MSYVVSTSTVAFSRGEDRPRSVQVPVCAMPAVRAPEGSFSQPEARLSLATLRAGHGCICGRHQHHRPTRPLAVFDQGPLGDANRGIGRLAGHPCLAQKFRLEVLNGNELVRRCDRPSPNPRGVQILSGSLLAQLGRRPTGLLVPVRLSTPPPSPSPCHFSLRPGKFRRTSPPMTSEWQRVLGGRCCCCGCDSPVNTDLAGIDWGRDDSASNHKRCIPMTKRVLVDRDGRRRAGQRPGPGHRNGCDLRKNQATMPNCDRAGRICQRQPCMLSGLHHWPTNSGHLEGLAQSLREGAQDLLLSSRGPSLAARHIAAELASARDRDPRMWASGQSAVDGRPRSTRIDTDPIRQPSH